MGPSIRAAGGIPLPNGFVWAALDANALWNSAGLDSGRVLLSVSAGFVFPRRTAPAISYKASPP